MATFDVSCGNDILLNSSPVPRDSDTDSENVSLTRLSVSDGQKTYSSNDVSLIMIIKSYITCLFAGRVCYQDDEVCPRR